MPAACGSCCFTFDRVRFEARRPLARFVFCGLLASCTREGGGAAPASSPLAGPVSEDCCSSRFTLEDLGAASFEIMSMALVRAVSSAVRVLVRSSHSFDFALQFSTRLFM